MSSPVLQKVLVRSQFLQILDLRKDVKLCAHSLSGSRIYVSDEIIELIESFRTPQQLSEWTAEQVVRHGGSRGQQALSCARSLLSEGILFDVAFGDEQQYWAAQFSVNVAHVQVGETVRPVRRARKYELSVPRSLQDYSGLKHKLSCLFFGACSAQLLVDFAREHAATAALELDARATTFQDVQLATEFAPDVIVVGQFPEKTGIFEYPPWGDSILPTDAYVDAARRFLNRIREQTAAPVLLLNVAMPTCSPLGIADGEHLNRARKLNLELQMLSTQFSAVYIVDVDQVLGLEGRRGLVDDALAGFGHLGSLPWLLHQYTHPRPGLQTYSNGLGPIPDLLAHDEFVMERLIAQQVVSIILALQGIDRKKCIVVDLDDTLWPGVLADNGSPFPGQPEFDVYPYGRYWGLHSALKALKSRGFLLACVSKNDQEVLDKLWRYEGVPSRLFLTPQDFITCRINWCEKAENLQSIARELNIGLDSFAFIDDNPIERAKIRQLLPEVMVIGDDPYTTRWILLNHHAFQVPFVTAESARRGEMMRQQLERDRAMASAADVRVFLETLNLQCTIERVHSSEKLWRIQELIDRTHQMNTTGKKWSTAELSNLIDRGAVYTMSAQDRFVDYGIVGVCVVDTEILEILVLSCRVLGLGLEHAFLREILNTQRGRHHSIDAKLIPTDRNFPARNLYADHGFRVKGSNLWEIDLEKYRPPQVAHIKIELLA